MGLDPTLTILTLSDRNSKYEQITADEVPESLYCLGVRRATEWFRNLRAKKRLAERKSSVWKLKDNSLYHFCIFSDNSLATSVVINSTTVNSEHPEKVVFHLVTDEVNYAPVKAWFSMNDFQGVTVEIQKIEDFKWLNASSNDDNKTPIKFQNPKYLSVLNHLRFYIPDVYSTLKKVFFLDDDVVVQKDLFPLCSIDLNDNVNAAVETCMETFHRYHKYLNYSHPLYAYTISF